MLLPNFLIIGAHKAGTTSLYAYLKTHPQIFMPEIKEARFFAFDPKNPDHIKKVPKIFPITTLNNYSELFGQVKDEIAIGEASPEYLNSEYAARNIYKHIPNVKLVVSLRNPIDRAYSQFLMAHRAGEFSNMKINDYMFSYEDEKKGFYYPKLKKYFDIFGRDQIKVILFDDLVSETDNTVKEVFKFLNVSESFTPDISTIHNQGGITKSRIIYNISKNKKLKVLIKTYMPHLLVSVLKNIKKSNIKKAPLLTIEQRIEAIKLVKDDICKVEDLIQHNLSSWYKL